MDHVVTDISEYATVTASYYVIGKVLLRNDVT